jgi:hypothetical protein
MAALPRQRIGGLRVFASSEREHLGGTLMHSIDRQKGGQRPVHFSDRPQGQDPGRELVAGCLDHKRAGAVANGSTAEPVPGRATT